MLHIMKKGCALLLIGVLLLSVIACQENVHPDGGASSESVDAGADTTQIPEIPTTEPPTTETQNKGPVPSVPTMEDSMNISSADLLELIRSGTIAADGDYTVTDGEGLVFDRKDYQKDYDLKNATIRVGVRVGEYAFSIKTKELTLRNANVAVYGGVAIGIESDNVTATLSDFHISGNAEAAFKIGGNECTVSACTISPDENATITTAIVVSGQDVLIQNCNIAKCKVGVLDQSANGATVQNNLISDCEVGVKLETNNSIVWSNTIQNCNYGISATDKQAEISAGEAAVFNVLAAKNKITGADVSIGFANISNAVALMNEVETLSIVGGINTYAINNRVSDTFTLKDNNYLIADRNTYGTFVNESNENVNGDNVTDLTARLEKGANEELLPHINKEQFAGMTPKSKFRSVYGTLNLYDYLKAALADGQNEIIIPPGSYINSAMTFDGVTNVSIYAYGTYNDTVRSTANAIRFTNCKKVTLCGLFFGNTTYPHTQGTVIEADGNGGVLKFITDPGYLSDFSSGNFGASVQGIIYKEDSLYPYSEVTYSWKKYDLETNVNSMKLDSSVVKGDVQVGDRVAFRNGMGASALSMAYCSEMVFEDVTVFSCSGFSEMDSKSDIAPKMHRYAVTAGFAPLLDGDADDYSAYSGYDWCDPEGNMQPVIWTDSYGRLRSAGPMNSTCDATHSTSARVGIQLISCLLENMHDDGGNINGYYGCAVDYDAATNTLTYKTCYVNTYSLLPQDFRVGDRIMLYTKDGKLIGDVTATSATKQTVFNSNANSCRYTVQISKDITLVDGVDQVIVQNVSANGGNFLWDNVVVRNTNSNGVRIMASDGEVRNCTFDGLMKEGISFEPQYYWWPEVGYAQNVKIINNVFHEIGLKPAQWAAWDNDEYAVINIRGGAKSPHTSDLNYCLHQNIEISGNEFSSRYSKYDIAISCAQDVKITNNTFTGRIGQESTDTQAPILLLGGNGIQIDGNDFADGISNPIENRNGSVENLSGDNVA